MKNNSRVNLFLVGAPKAATSTIANGLAEHNDIFISPIKEPHYFSAIQGLGPTKCISGRAAYENLYRASDREKYLCDASTTYLYFPEAAKRIHDYNPDAKIIISLRAPTQRAFSHYLMDRYAIGHETAGVREALLDINHHGKYGFHGLRVNPYLFPSCYSEHVSRFIDVFGSQQVKIVFMESLKANKREFFDDLFHFLEIDCNKELNIRELNGRRQARSPYINRAVRKILPQRLTAAMPGPVKEFVRRQLFKSMPSHRLAIDIEHEMYERFFVDDINKLSTLTSLNIPWSIMRAEKI